MSLYESGARKITFITALFKRGASGKHTTSSPQDHKADLTEGIFPPHYLFDITIPFFTNMPLMVQCLTVIYDEGVKCVGEVKVG